jgi:hypothetical protein
MEPAEALFCWLLHPYAAPALLSDAAVLILSIGWIDGDDASEVSKQALAKRIL